MTGTFQQLVTAINNTIPGQMFPFNLESTTPGSQLFGMPWGKDWGGNPRDKLTFLQDLPALLAGSP